MDLQPILQLTKIAMEDLQKAFSIDKDLYFYVENEILKNEDLVGLLNVRNDNFDWTKQTPLGGAGTSLNAIILYCLIRHMNMSYVIETGVSGGYYTAFMMEALCKTGNWPMLTSLEISNDMSQVGKLIPKNIQNKIKRNGSYDELDWKLVTGKSSLEYFSQLKANNSEHSAQLYSHDSLHTKSFMLKELSEFKKSTSKDFFIFIDDEKSDGFWDWCVSNKQFKKQNYNVKYISGKESRLNGHLGGFIQFKKKKGDQ